jgi:hypothetical protein
VLGYTPAYPIANILLTTWGTITVVVMAGQLGPGNAFVLINLNVTRDPMVFSFAVEPFKVLDDVVGVLSCGRLR